MLKNILFAGIISVVTFSSCNKNNSENEKTAELSGTVKIDGSSTVYPITEAVAEEFTREQPKVQVTVGESGTGGGFKKFGRDEIDICDASRKIKQEEINACKAAGIEYLELEIAYDGLAVIINPQNNWVDHLTVEELKKIWEPSAQKAITKWSQVRNGWPDEEIHLFGPGTASGTYDYFTEAICGEKGASRGDYTASENDNVLVQGIKNDKNALGYFGMAYYENNKDILKLVPIDNGNGPVLPTKETVLNKTYAPLSRPLFIYVNMESIAKPEVKEFVHYYIENAAALSEDVGYVPLPDNEYQLMKDKLNKSAESK